MRSARPHAPWGQHIPQVYSDSELGRIYSRAIIDRKWNRFLLLYEDSRFSAKPAQYRICAKYFMSTFYRLELLGLGQLLFMVTNKAFLPNAIFAFLRKGLFSGGQLLFMVTNKSFLPNAIFAFLRKGFFSGGPLIDNQPPHTESLVFRSTSNSFKFE